MSTLTFHGANRVLERGITIEAIQRITDQSAGLLRIKEMTTPIANGKVLKIRYGGQQYTVTDKAVTTMIKVKDTAFVIGINEQHPAPIIVTAWSTSAN